MARPRRPASERPPQLARSLPIPAIAFWEYAGLAVLLVLALGLRCSHWDKTTVEHFDEGVYASNLWFGPEAGGQYPQRHLYAPPLLPWLIDLSMVVHGTVEGHPALWPSLVASVVTILVVWCLARMLDGPLAALFSTGLATVSGLHLLLARAALTDCLLGALFLFAFLLFVWGIRRERVAPCLASGLAVGGAWLTKYNGWLPLFILGVAIVAYLVLGSRNRLADARRLFGRLVGAAGVALGLWIPYWWSLADRGGYAAVAANHRKYLVGVSGWWESLVRQLDSLFFLGGFGNADLFTLLLGLAGSLGVLRDAWRARQRSASTANSAEPVPFDRWTIAVGYLLLAAMTPLYTPYPRLVLPWLTLGWLAAGGWIARLAGSARLPPAANARRWREIVVGTTVLIVVLGLVENTMRGTYWPARTGWQQIASQIVADIRRDSRPDQLPEVIYTYGEPPLLFQLRAAGVVAVQPIQDLDLTPAMLTGQELPTYLVVGPHAQRDPQFLREWPRHAGRYRLVKTYSFAPSPLVLLDNFAASAVRGRRIVEEVRVYGVASDERRATRGEK